MPDSDPTSHISSLKTFHGWPSNSKVSESGNPEGKGGTNHTQTPPPVSTRFSHLGVPAAAGMGDWYENDATQPQACLNATAPALVIPAPIRHSGESRSPEGRGRTATQRAGRIPRPVFIPDVAFSTPWAIPADAGIQGMGSKSPLDATGSRPA